jgi:hypothetical protein
MEVKAFFDKDTRRYHRLLIDGEEVKGTIYFVRDGERIPDKLTISLETSREKGINRKWPSNPKQGIFAKR